MSAAYPETLGVILPLFLSLPLPLHQPYAGRGMFPLPDGARGPARTAHQTLTLRCGIFAQGSWTGGASVPVVLSLPVSDGPGMPLLGCVIGRVLLPEAQSLELGK